MNALTIPSNWNDVTIEGYVAFMKSAGKENEIENPADLSRLQQARVCYLTGCEPEEAKKVTTKEYARTQRLVKIPLPVKLKLKFKLNGIRYRIIYQHDRMTGERSDAISKLDTINKLDASKMDGGGYASIMNCAKRGHLDTLHQIMFLLSEPVKWGFRKKWIFLGWKAYDFKEYEVEDRINDFQHLTMEIANPVAVFFCNLSKVLTIGLEDYSLSEMNKMTTKMKKLQQELENDSDG